MGIRCDQLIGLNTWAIDFIYKLKELAYTDEIHRTYTGCAHPEILDPVQVYIHYKVVMYKTYYGMFNTEYPLHRYTTSEGKVYEEVLQAEPWASGPMFFLALQDGNGDLLPNSLWTDEEIEEYL